MKNKDNIPQFNVDDDEIIETVKKKEQKKKHKGKPNTIVYVISVLLFLGLVFHSVKIGSLVMSLTFLPEKYLSYTKIGLISVCCLFSIYALLPVNNLNKIIQSVLCVALCVGIVYGQNTLTAYIGRLERLFTDIPSEGELSINVYSLSGSSINEVKDLENKKIAIQTQIDAEYQEYAIMVINKELKGKEVDLVECPDIFAALDALYSGEVDALMLNKSYESIITSNADFVDFETETKIVYTCIQRISLTYDSSAVGDITSEPFLIMIGGNDSWDYYDVLNDTGRTDVNMLCVVNPNTKQILLITIPRDSYVSLWGNKNRPDKLTHATCYDIECWEEAVEEKLDVEINYYIRVCFSSIINIVDAVGGIDVYNPYGFMQNALHINGDKGEPEFWIEEGELHLDGVNALAYARCRYGLENGDMSRNEHQAIVLKALIDKIISIDGITHVPELFEAVNGTFKTDITVDQLYALAQMQLDDMADWTLTQYSMTGTTGSDVCYIMGMYGDKRYSVVYLNEESIKTAQQYIQKIIAGESLAE